MGFITKVDFSDNRQVKQYEETSTQLSGATVFGVVFSALTNGPDLTTSATTSTTTGITSTFSGNTGTTVFTFGNANMLIGNSYITPITSSNSGTTQIIGPIFTASTSTIIDGNTVNLTYSGVSFTLQITNIEEISTNIYTGVTNSTLYKYSADTLDYTGRTIWSDVKGINRTEKLIISDLAVPGYVWTCTNNEGYGTWVAPSGTTGYMFVHLSGDTMTGNLSVPNLIVTGATKTQSFGLSPTSAVTTTAIISSEYSFYWLSGATPFNITLPLASSYPDLEIQFKNIGSPTITINRNGSETIDGAISTTLIQWESKKVKSNGYNWFLI